MVGVLLYVSRIVLRLSLWKETENLCIQYRNEKQFCKGSRCGTICVYENSSSDLYVRVLVRELINMSELFCTLIVKL